MGWSEDVEESGVRSTTQLLRELAHVQNLRSLLPKKSEYIGISQLISELANQMVVSRSEMKQLKKFLDD